MFTNALNCFLTQAYEDKLKDLKKLTKKLWERVAEYQERPKVRSLGSSTVQLQILRIFYLYFCPQIHLWQWNTEDSNECD